MWSRLCDKKKLGREKLDGFELLCQEPVTKKNTFEEKYWMALSFFASQFDYSSHGKAYVIYTFYSVQGIKQVLVLLQRMQPTLLAP